MTNQMTTTNNTFSLVPRDFQEALEFARLMASSDMVPKDYKGKPANVIVAIQMGLDLGLNPMQSIQNIAVINGRPCLWGDAVLAIVKSRRDCRGVIETYEDVSKKAVCIVKRQGHPDVERSFSVEDAKTAGLWGKQGPWTSYPKRMLQMRARSFACRDAFPDALRGISTAEEMQDVVDAKTGAPAEKPQTYVDAEFTSEAKDEPQVESDSKAKAAIADTVSDLLYRIDGAASKEDLSALRSEILALPKGSPERQKVIDAGVQKNLELDALRQAEEHASATHDHAMSDDSSVS